MYQFVIRNYPGTPEAALAERDLARLSDEARETPLPPIEGYSPTAEPVAEVK
jgi:hypothetical protein